MGLLRRTLQVLLLLATLAVGAAALAIIVSQTAWFRDWLRGVVVREANQYLNGTLSIGRLGGNLVFGLEIHDLGILQNGDRVIAIKNVGLDYSVVRFIRGNLAIDHIRLDQPQVHLRREAGKWNLSGLVRKQRQEKERQGPGRSVSIGEIGISDGRIVLDSGASAVATGTAGSSAGPAVPASIERLDARLSFAYEPVHYSVDVAHLSFRSVSPDLSLNALSGKVAVRNDTLWLDHLAVRTAESSFRVDGEVSEYLSRPVLKLQASSDKFSMAEVGRFVPALSGIPLQPSFRVSANGPLDRVSFDFAVRSSAGDASGQVTADLMGPDRGMAGTVHVAKLDLAPIVKTPAAVSRITGIANIDLRFPAGPGRGPVTGTFTAKADEATVAGYSARHLVARGRVDGRNLVTLTGATALAYGGSGSAAGTIQPGVRGPDGEPGVALDLHGAVSGLDLRMLPRRLKVPAVESRLTFDYRVAGVGAALRGDAVLDSSTLAGATLGAQTKASFSNTGPRFEYAADGTAERLDLQRIGREFKIDALATDRFSSSLNGRFVANGRGTTVATLGLDAVANLSTSTLNGMRMPSMGVEAHVADGAGRFRAAGTFEALDPARVTGDQRLRGKLGGQVDAEFGLTELTRVTPDTLSASGAVSLWPSSIGDLSIQRAALQGQYSASTATITRLEIAGPDILANGKGTLALGKSGASDLAYHVESPKLTMIGQLVGQPLRGAVTLDGKVSGNGAMLQTSGTLKGSDLGYQDNRALGVEGRYQAAVPDRDIARATVGADLDATLLEAGGLEINQLKMTGRYADQALRFDATARSVPREARVAGTLLLHTDHQEVHLTSFSLRTQGIEWALPAGRQPVVQYGGGRVQVKGMRLVSGQQAINVEGTLDSKASDLRASITDLDLARLDTWLVGEHRLGGTLNAGAHVTGPSASLLVQGDFSVDHGSFREFSYETLGGNVNYTGGRVTLDVRLFQSPQAWIAAHGTVPTALWSSPAANSSPAGRVDPAADSPVELTIDSSPIGLGLVQGFTGAIIKTSGSMEAHVRVTGQASDPQMSGGVGITNGAFTVPSTGVGYRGLSGRIDLQPGRAVFNGMAVADEHGNKASVSGDVRFQQKAIGSLALALTSRDFEVLHNDLGRVTLDSDVKVGGSVQEPRVEGTLAIGTGQINIDKVLDLTTSSAYSTKPENLDGQATEPSLFADPNARPQAAAANTLTPPPTAAAGTVPLLPVGTSGVGTIAPLPKLAANRGPYDAMLLNVHVKVPPSLVVKGKDLRPGGGSIGLGNVNVTLGGDLRFEKEPDRRLRLVGQVTTVRGTYDFQGRRFDIQRDGRVRFDGAMPIDPALDIAATRVISGVEARVHVGGSMAKPELALTSRPPLEQADILALIVFNQPANQLGEGQQASLAERAGAIATGFVASKLADSIGRALNLDTFEIQTAPESTGGQGAEVTVGQQLGQKLYVKLTQGVGAENLSQFVIDYQLAQFLRLSTTITQGESATRSLVRRVERSGVDLIFFFSY